MLGLRGGRLSISATEKKEEKEQEKRIGIKQGGVHPPDPCEARLIIRAHEAAGGRCTSENDRKLDWLTPSPGRWD